VSRKRPWLAAALAFVYPGLGHAYLRSWLRAGVWFLLAVMTAALVIPESVVTAFESGGLRGMATAMDEVSFGTVAPLLIVRGLCIADAYVSARRDLSYGKAGGNAKPENACPACGKELDEDLDFCPWCTTRIEWEDSTSR
jgi:hypothetical protein